MNKLFISQLHNTKQNNIVILRCYRNAYAQALLRELVRDYNCVDIAQPNLRILAKRDVAAFVQGLKLPVFLANLQYTPQLLSELVKLPRGCVLASCTQSALLEKLAQQVAHVRFLELPIAETGTQNFVRALSLWQKPRQCAGEKLWLEIYPAQRHKFYGEYLREVLQADIIELTQVSDWLKFYRFMEAAAMLLGEEVNYAKLGRLADITPATAKNWLKLLLGTGMIYLLEPVRSVKINRPRLYFRDAGLACFMLGFKDAQAAARCAQSSCVLQNYLLNCLRDGYINEGSTPSLHFCPKNRQSKTIVLRWCSALNLKVDMTEINKK